MAVTTDLAATSPVPGADLERAEKFAREAFLHAGEDAAQALAEGTPRRRALDAALAQLDGGRKEPSVGWRREFSLMLGLERLLSQEEPHLADGTELSAHQVDALSGTLIALLAEAQNGVRSAEAGSGEQAALAGPDGRVATDGPGVDPVAAGDEEPEDDDALVLADVEVEEEQDEGSDGADTAEAATATGEGDDEEPLPDEDEPLPDEEEPVDWEPDAAGEEEVEEAPAEALEDPGAPRRFWFEHATGAGKTVAALGFAEASRTGGILILTHRRNLVEQFQGELLDRGYRDRVSPALLKRGSGEPPANGPVTVETYQWFVRNAGKISDAYTIVICDEAHTALGEKTSAAIRGWRGPIFIGMTATGALIARHVTDLFPTQTSRFDLAQAARRGVIAPLRCVRIPPGVGVNTIAKVPLRRGEVDQDFDLEELAALLDQGPFNAAVADLYRVRFRNLPGVVYAAGVRHAHNVAQAFRDAGIEAMAVSGETPKRELTRVLAAYERGEIDVLVNAQLLAEGWNSPRATVCMHLAPTASKRVYQQRVGRVTRRQPGKEAGIVVDFVHPATPNDDPVVTLHSLLDREVYRGGAIVVGPVRRGRGRRLRVERRVVPVAAEQERRYAVFERELWRIAVENLPWVDQHAWAALAGARVASSNWRRAKAMLQFDRSGELRKRFLLTCLQRNRNTQLRLRALAEVPDLRDPDAFTEAVDLVGTWSRDERREGVKVLLGALAERQVGRRDQAASWIWELAGYTREVHEEYAAQRWPETKRLLGLLVNSSGAAHGRNARRLVHQARQHDRRLCAALLAAAVGHTPEAMQVLTGARTRMARKPSALARELLRNFPKGRRRRGGRRRRRSGGDRSNGGANAAKGAAAAETATAKGTAAESAAGESAAAEAAADGSADKPADDAAPTSAPEGDGERRADGGTQRTGEGERPAEAA